MEGKSDTIRRRSIITFSLVPGNHLLIILNAFRSIARAISRWLCWCNGGMRCRASDIAFEALHVDVRLSAAFGDPKPGTVAASWWAGREIGDLEGCEAFPGCAM